MSEFLVRMFNSTYQNVNFICNGFFDLITNGVFWALEVIPGFAGVVHEGEEAVLHPDQHVVLAHHIGHLHVVRGGADVLQLFACTVSQGPDQYLAKHIIEIFRLVFIDNSIVTCKYIEGDKVDFCMAVFPRL